MFEPQVVFFEDSSVAIYLRTLTLSTAVSSVDLVRLSSHPSQELSQLRMTVEKICAVLGTGNLSSRVATRAVQYLWYPYIHIFEYEPRDETRGLPWHEFAVIGTRHTKISPSSQPLAQKYKAKNRSIRDGVLVVDKQSTLVVENEEYLELQGVRYCLAVALRMRQLLEAKFHGHDVSHFTPANLDGLKLTIERPSVFTDSQNYRTLWPHIAQECQVVEWLTNLEQKPKGQEIGESQSRLGRLFNRPRTAIPSGIEPKGIQWLHLSDFHFKANSNQSQDQVLSALSLDVKQVIDDGQWKPDFIAVTGDISFSGQDKEFHRAAQFLENILAICKLERARLFMVPGNHDVNRTTHQPSLLKALREAKSQGDYERIAAELGDRDTQALLVRRLSAYREFLRDFYKSPSIDESLWFVSKLVGERGATAAIAGLTSVWASGEDEEDEKRYLAVGHFQSRPALRELRQADADIRLVMLHHPLDALQRQDEQALEQDLRGVCDLLLRGHLHQTNLTLRADPDWGFATLAAGSAYETKWSKNGYLLVNASVCDSHIQLKIKARKWGDGGFFGADTSTYFQGRENGVFTLKLPRERQSRSSISLLP